MFKTHRANSRTLRVTMALTTSLTLMSFSATTANADKRQPAPVVFATPANTSAPVSSRSANRAAATRAVQHSVRQVAAPTQTPSSDRRVEFRYPDQPDVFYGQGGARRSDSAAPLNFSSSKSAISAADARQYAMAEPSVNIVPAPSRDPAITSGGFDARAAAAQTATRQAAPKPSFVSAAGRADFTTPVTAPQQARNSAPARTQTVAFQPVSSGVVYDESGKASVFDPALNGQMTANGEVLDTNAMVAAHPSLPLPSLVQVINQSNGKEIVVRVNDRGPFVGGGLIEVSNRAADLLGFSQTGSADVRVRYLGPAPKLAAEAPQTAPTPAPAFAQLAEEPLFGGPQTAYTPTPTRAPAPRLPVADPSFATGGYSVQLASFSDLSNARRMHDQLKGQVGVSITSARVRGTDYFRVVTTPVADRRAAEMLRDRLARQGVASGLVITAP